MDTMCLLLEGKLEFSSGFRILFTRVDPGSFSLGFFLGEGDEKLSGERKG